MLSDMMAEGRMRKREEAEIKHRESMADKKAAREYMELYNATNEDGRHSPRAWVVSFIILMLGVTYCTATLSCFYIDPGHIVYTKDPSEDAKKFSILFGAIEWDRSNNRVISMSRAGLGYIMLHPIIFIISMVTTGDRPSKRR
jgi:hypothetical protein